MMQRIHREARLAGIVLLAAMTAGCGLFGRTVGREAVQLDGGHVVYFKVVARRAGSLMYLTLTADPCRPPDPKEDYVFDDGDTAVWYVARQGTLIVYGTRPTMPARPWPVRVEYREVDWEDPREISLFHTRTVKEQGLHRLLMPEARYVCY